MNDRRGVVRHETILSVVVSLASTRVACVARALLMMNIKSACLERFPLSTLVSAAADRMDAGMLALQLKASLKAIRTLRRDRLTRID